MRVDMLLQSTDPKTQEDLEKIDASFWMEWRCLGWQDHFGYDEMQRFYVKMAKELEWLPGRWGWRCR